MKKANQHIGKPRLTKVLSIALMLFSLLFLTTANYFVYPGNGIEKCAAVADDDQPNAPNATEEKASSSLSVVEEIFHDHHFHIEHFISSELFLHKIHVMEKLEAIPIDLLSPPPEA